MLDVINLYTFNITSYRLNDRCYLKMMTFTYFHMLKKKFSANSDMAVYRTAFDVQVSVHWFPVSTKLLNLIKTLV